MNTVTANGKCNSCSWIAPNEFIMTFAHYPCVSCGAASSYIVRQFPKDEQVKEITLNVSFQITLKDWFTSPESFVADELYRILALATDRHEISAKLLPTTLKVKKARTAKVGE